MVNCHSLAFCIGAIVAYIWTYYRFPEKYREHVDGLAVWMTLAGILGARLLYCAIYWKTLTSAAHIFMFWEGGLVSYGGFVAAVLAWVIYIRVHGLPLAECCDALGPAGLLGWGIGRIGCFLNWYGECGIPTELPWGFIVDGDVPRHPVMLYLAVGHIIMAFVSLRLARRYHLNAAGTALCAFGGVRLLLDFTRQYAYPWLNWGSAAISLIFFIAGIAIMLKLPAPEAASATNAPATDGDSAS